MLNAGDLFIALVIGLALPLALLDGLRSLGASLPRQRAGFQVETRAQVWLWVLAAGPGLLLERLAADWREARLDWHDAVSGCVILMGWATVHGYVVLSAVRMLLPS